MFGSQVLEVCIGLVLVFVLVSIICSAIREVIEAWVKSRAAFLERGIRELLHDKSGTGLAASFYNHPLIYSLFADEYKPGSATARPGALTRGGALPSYIPTRNFALALMDLAARGSRTDIVSSDARSPQISLESLRLNVANLQNPAVQRVMLTALDVAQGDLNRVQAYLESWYDSGMDRVSGWYKRSTQWVIFWIAFVLVAGLNVNPITITHYLSHNEAARTALVARAEATVKASAGKASLDYRAAKLELDSLALPIGWSQGWGAPRQHPLGAGRFEFWNDLLAPLAGLLLAAFAATLGAPFWFDVLNKLMVIRSTVKPHEKSPEEASDDRQLPAGPPEPLPGPAPVSPVSPAPGPTSLPVVAPVVVVPPVVAPPVAPPAPADLIMPTPRDEHSHKDSCGLKASVVTSDETLPAAEGGVA